MDYIYSIFKSGKGEYNLEIKNNVYTIPNYKQKIILSDYDYFSYPLGICKNKENMLLSCLDCAIPFTNQFLSLTNYGFLDKAYYPEEQDYIKTYYVGDFNYINYIFEREPSSIVYGKRDLKINNYYKTETFENLFKLNGNERNLDVAIITSIKEISVINLIKENGTLIVIVKEIDIINLVNIVENFESVNLYKSKMVSPLLCIIGRKLRLTKNKEILGDKVNEFYKKSLEYFESLEVPEDSIPSNIVASLMNL